MNMMTSWYPIREFEDLLERYNRVGSRVLRGNNEESGLLIADWSPTVDIEESDESYLIKADLPGVKKDDIEVTLENGVLNIKGEKRVEKEVGKGTRRHRAERFYGTFVRSFTLPRAVQGSKVDAHYEDGVLSLLIPKAEEAKPKAIKVKVR